MSDAAAWIGESMDRHQAELVRYAARLLGDPDRARDVVQETFLKLWQAERAAVEGHLAQWLYTVCRHRALDELRKDGRMSAYRSQATAARPPGPPPRSSDENPPAMGVLGLVERLPPRQQEMLRLRFQGGLSYRQIAEVTGLTVSHVGVLIHKAVNSLREQLDAAAQPDGLNPGLSRR